MARLGAAGNVVLILGMYIVCTFGYSSGSDRGRGSDEKRLIETVVSRLMKRASGQGYSSHNDTTSSQRHLAKNPGNYNYNNSRSTTPSAWWAAPSEWALEDYPNPRYDVRKCGRNGYPSYVCDPSNIMTPIQVSIVDRAIEECYQQSRCACGTCPPGRDGYRIAVAMVPKLKLRGGAIPTREELQIEIERWAVNLRSFAWNYGYCNDDIVIVVSRDDRKVFTSTGLTARRLLKNECVDSVFSEAKDYFRNGDFGGGLEYMVLNYRDVILGHRGCARISSGTTGLSTGTIVGIVIGCVVLVGAVAIVCLAKRDTLRSGSSSSATYTRGNRRRWGPRFGFNRNRRHSYDRDDYRTGGNSSNDRGFTSGDGGGGGGGDF